MYAFVLELKPQDVHLCGATAIARIQEEYDLRLRGKSVLVKKLANSRYGVSFEHEDYNFNWCFGAPDYLKLEAIELTIPNIVIPSTRYDPLHRYANGFFRAFPYPSRFPSLCCELTIDPRRRIVKIRAEVNQEHGDEVRSGMFGVVHGVMDLGRMMKWLDRLLAAYQEKNYGKAERATAKVVEAMARSAPFLTLP